MRLGRLEEVNVRWMGRSAFALGIVFSIGSASWADIQTAGVVTYVSADAVEVDGKRALLRPDSHITSGGRAISATSLRRGMFVEAEIDDAGQLIMLEANGVVE